MDYDTWPQMAVEYHRVWSCSIILRWPLWGLPYLKRKEAARASSASGWHTSLSWHGYICVHVFQSKKHSANNICNIVLTVSMKDVGLSKKTWDFSNEPSALRLGKTNHNKPPSGMVYGIGFTTWSGNRLKSWTSWGAGYWRIIFWPFSSSQDAQHIWKRCTSKRCALC